MTLRPDANIMNNKTQLNDLNSDCQMLDKKVPYERRQQIHFGNVKTKRLEMEYSSQSIPANITFSNLIEFQTDAIENIVHNLYFKSFHFLFLFALLCYGLRLPLL